MKDKICPKCGSPVPWEEFEYTCEICGYPMEPTLEEMRTATTEINKLMSGAICSYVINIRCDHPDHVDDFFNGIVLANEFTGYTDAECVKQARAEGWVFHRHGKLTCPDCRRHSRPARVG